MIFSHCLSSKRLRISRHLNKSPYSTVCQAERDLLSPHNQRCLTHQEVVSKCNGKMSPNAEGVISSFEVKLIKIFGLNVSGKHLNHLNIWEPDEITWAIIKQEFSRIS